MEHQRGCSTLHDPDSDICFSETNLESFVVFCLTTSIFILPLLVNSRTRVLGTLPLNPIHLVSQEVIHVPLRVGLLYCLTFSTLILGFLSRRSSQTQSLTRLSFPLDLPPGWRPRMVIGTHHMSDSSHSFSCSASSHTILLSSFAVHNSIGLRPLPLLCPPRCYAALGFLIHFFTHRPFTPYCFITL